MISGNLFTRDYLLEGITRSEPWKALADGEIAALKVWSPGARAKACSPSTSLTRRKPKKLSSIRSSKLLGWQDVEVQQNLSPKGRKHVPDALLFADKTARNRAVAEKDQSKRYQHGLAVTEAKRRAGALDCSDKRDRA